MEGSKSTCRESSDVLEGFGDTFCVKRHVQDPCSCCRYILCVVLVRLALGLYAMDPRRGR